MRRCGVAGARWLMAVRCASSANGSHAQGGDARVTDDFGLLPLAACDEGGARASSGGFVAGFDAEGVGRSAMVLGAGRATKDDPIDFGAGLLLAVRTGDAVSAGDLLCTMWSANEELLDSAAERFLASVSVSSEPTQPPPLFHEM